MGKRSLNKKHAWGWNTVCAGDSGGPAYVDNKKDMPVDGDIMYMLRLENNSRTEVLRRACMIYFPWYALACLYRAIPSFPLLMAQNPVIFNSFLALAKASNQLMPVLALLFMADLLFMAAFMAAFFIMLFIFMTAIFAGQSWLKEIYDIDQYIN